MTETYRLRLVYPYNTFKARINYKNVIPGKPWTDGPLFFDGTRNYYILEKNTDGEGYFFRNILTDALYLNTYYKNGKAADIYEGDIIKITGFEKLAGGFMSADDIIRQLSGAKEEKDEGIYETPPSGSHITATYSGYVFYYGDMPCIQYMNYVDGTMCCTPLYQFFGENLLPAEGFAVQTLGNIYDNPDILESIFSTELKTGYSHEVNNQENVFI
ncbi:MAG: hypothetical protein IJ446_06375 [Oscillospiraceae bacterium]|nr:hypothetical protein [Oscillospiraceae bacterium]